MSVTLLEHPTETPETMVDVLERPIEDIPTLIANGEIAHSMVITAFAFMGLVPKVLTVGNTGGR